MPRGDRSAPTRELDRPGPWAHVDHLVTQDALAAGLRDIVCQPAGDGREVHDPGVRRVERPQPDAVGLDRGDLVRVETPHARHPVGVRPALELTNFITIGLLPASLRHEYRLTWGSARELTLRVGAEYTKRLVLPVLPPVIRYDRAAA